MLSEYSHTKSESLAQIRTTMAKIQHFLLGNSFLLAHPAFLILFLISYTGRRRGNIQKIAGYETPALYALFRSLR